MHSAKRLIISAATFGLLLSTPLSQANELELRISNDWVNAQYTVDEPESKSNVGLGYLYKDDNGSVNIANLDLHAKGQTAIGNLPTTIGIGFQGNYYKADSFKGSAIAVGGKVRVNIPKAPGVSLETAIYYAPDVLAFGDSDEFRRATGQVNYRVIENADLSLGYQYINVGDELSNKNITLEKGAFVGFRLKL